MILREFHHPSFRLTCLPCDIEQQFDTAAIMARVDPDTPLPLLLSDMAGELGCPAVRSGADCITFGATKCHLYFPELAARPAVCGPASARAPATGSGRRPKSMLARAERAALST